MQIQVPERLYGHPAGNVFSLDTARRRRQALQATRDESHAAAALATFQAGRLPFIGLMRALISPFNAELRNTDPHEAEVRRLAEARP